MTKDKGGPSLAPPEPPADQELELLRAQRFEQRVRRVMEAMTVERIAFQGRVVSTPEGHLIVQVFPVEMPTDQGPMP